MRTLVLPATPEAITRAAALLRAGDIVVMPTETVYGLAADATLPDAVARVFAAKERPADDPLIVHVSSRQARVDALGSLVGTLTDAARRTATKLTTCWPGPLTLVLPRGPSIPDAVTSGLPFVALRCPAHPTAQALLDALGRPVVAPSANRFGRISPTTAAAAHAELDGRVPLILDAGPCGVGVESTVLRVDADGGTTLLRPGAVTAADITALTGHAPRTLSAGPRVSPGLLESHYAPRTPLVLVPTASSADPAVRARVHARSAEAAWLTWTPPSQATLAALRPRASRALTARGDPAEAAARLYESLRSLDRSGASLIVCERPPSHDGLCAALQDRLQRAAAATPPLV